MTEALHGDPIATLILSLAIILLAAKIGAHFAIVFGQPPVLGELTAGVVLGNLTLTGFHGLDYLRSDASVDTLSRLGVILLLFQVGLESTVAQMMRVGFSSFMVATLGARLGYHTSYQFSDANLAFATPRGGRRTVPMRRPSFFVRAVPSLTMRIAMACGACRTPQRRVQRITCR